MTAPALATETEVQQPQKKKFEALHAHRMSPAESKRMCWHVVAPADTERDALTASCFWLGCSSRFTSMDRVEVVLEDRSKLYEILILEASQSHVSAIILNEYILPSVAGDGTNSNLPLNYEVFFSQVDQYCARRLSDSVLIIKNEPSREACINALRSHPAFKED